MKTTTERMKAMRERRRAAGLTEVRLWVHPDDEREVREAAAKLQRRREREKKQTSHS